MCTFQMSRFHTLNADIVRGHVRYSAPGKLLALIIQPESLAHCFCHDHFLRVHLC
jgi:hypothetical protein